MNFGTNVRPADTIGPTEWIGQSCQNEEWTVGALVPNQYEALLRVHAPPPIPGDWWSTYRDLFEAIATIGQRHTSNPQHALFAIWEGHGFNTGAIRSELGQIPTFSRPNRTYYLLEGPVTAVSDLRFPGSHDWQHPDLFWPKDQQWFIATDVDFWSLYIGGSNTFIAEVAQTIPTRSEPVAFDLPLEIED